MSGGIDRQKLARLKTEASMLEATHGALIDLQLAKRDELLRVNSELQRINAENAMLRPALRNERAAADLARTVAALGDELVALDRRIGASTAQLSPLRRLVDRLRRFASDYGVQGVMTGGRA
jgi:hypothetical protein